MAPNLKNCSKCGRLFASGNRDICSKCLEKEGDDFSIIRNYLREHPGANVRQVAEATQIDEKVILKYLREGRLVAAQSSGSTITCQRCGKAISQGKYCTSCLTFLEVQFKSVLSSNRPLPKTEPAASNKKKERIHIKESDSHYTR